MREVELNIKAEHSQELVLFGNDLLLVGDIHLWKNKETLKLYHIRWKNKTIYLIKI